MLDNTPIVHSTASAWAVPSSFCWTRMGEESGESLAGIIRRKDLERRAASGAFIWGIGNGLGAGIRFLVASQPEPEVLFSLIRSPAATIDREPDGVLLWLDYVRPDGTLNELPAASFVTSRNSTPKLGRKAMHFGLFCCSDEPLQTSKRGIVRFGELRNLATQKPVGYSQVTAVVERSAATVGSHELAYPVVLAARLQEPFFARLATPISLDRSDAALVEAAAIADDAASWVAIVESIKDRYRPRSRQRVQPMGLFG